MCSYSTCNRKFQNNSQKIQKKLEHTIIASFEAKICWERPIKREKKKNHSNVFLLDLELKIPNK